MKSLKQSNYFFFIKDVGSGEIFKDDPICQKFLADSEGLAMIDNTKVASSIDYSQYQVVFVPG